MEFTLNSSVKLGAVWATSGDSRRYSILSYLFLQPRSHCSQSNTSKTMSAVEQYVDREWELLDLNGSLIEDTVQVVLYDGRVIVVS